MNTLYQKRFFNNHTHQYKKDLLVNPPRYVQEELSQLLQLIPPMAKKVIDFGCGTGRLTIPILRRGIKVIGIDISNKSLEMLKKNIKEIIPEKKGNFSFANRISNEKVKVVVGTDILHHVSLKDIIPEIYNSLQPGGIALFSEPNALNISWYIYLSLFIDWEAEKGVVNCSQYNLRSLFTRYGFKRVHFIPYGIVPPIFFNSIPFLQKINYAVARMPIINLFSYRFIIYAEK